jgi:hypothetical protein
LHGLATIDGKNLLNVFFRENTYQFRYLHGVLLVTGGGKILPTFECTKNVGLQSPFSKKLPWWRRSSGTTMLLSPMCCSLQSRSLPHSHLQRCRSNRLLNLIAWFAAWALGISSQPNIHCF